TWTATGAVAVAAGPLIGGVLADELGWRTLFVLNLVGALSVLVIAARGVPAIPARAGRGFDLAGQLLAMLTLCAVTVGLVQVGRTGWTSHLTMGCLLIAVCAGVSFALVERTARTPIVPTFLLRIPAFTATVGVGLLLNFAYYGQVFVLALYFGTVALYSPVHIGLALLPMTVTLAISNTIVGRLIDRIGGRMFMVAGSAVFAAGVIALGLLGTDATYPSMLVPLLVAGLGCGLAVASMMAVLLTAVPASHVGVASGVLNSSRQVGGVIGVALFGSMVASDQFADGMRATQLLAGSALALASLLSVRYVHRNAGR
ncbi:MAG: MFS transporter, partial [Actinomycetes bacterium]